MYFNKFYNIFLSYTFYPDKILVALAKVYTNPIPCMNVSFVAIVHYFMYGNHSLCECFQFSKANCYLRLQCLEIGNLSSITFILLKNVNTCTFICVHIIITADILYRNVSFLQVLKAEADDICGPAGSTRLVAVKTVKEDASQREKDDLLREMEIMKQLGAHPNVVTLLGCCTEQGDIKLA